MADIPANADTGRAINAQLTRWQVVVVAVAVGITGFFGFPTGTYPGGANGPTPGWVAFLDVVFRRPWLLFGAVSWLLIALMLGLAWKPAQERKRRQLLAASAASILIIAVFDLFHNEIGDFLNTIFAGHVAERLATNWLTYLVIDLGIIVALAADAYHRRDRLRHGKFPSPLYDPTTGTSLEPSPEHPLPDPQEITAGDLLLRAVLVGLLALVLLPQVIGLLVSQVFPTLPIHVGAGFDRVGDTSLPAFTPASVTIPGIDLALTTLNILVFALTLVAGWLMTAVAELLAGRTARDAARALWRIVRDGLQGLRPIRALYTLRVLLWPLATLAAFGFAAQFSRSMQSALHLVRVPLTAPGLVQHELGFLGAALMTLVWGVLSLLFVLLAVSLLVNDEALVAEATGDLTNGIGRAAVVFSAFSLALGAVNLAVLLLLRYSLAFFQHGLVSIMAPASTQPFDYRLHPFTPGILTVLSILVAIVLGLPRRRTGKPQQSNQPPQQQGRKDF